MSHNRIFSLETARDFEDFRDKLAATKYDLADIKYKEVFYCLDYHIIYELCRPSNRLVNLSIRYWFDSIKNYNCHFTILPISFFEMKCNIEQINKLISNVSYKDFEAIKKDKKVNNFKEKFELFKKFNNLETYQHAIRAFRDAFISNSNRSVVKAFKKVIHYFYYDKLYVQPYLETLRLTEHESFIPDNEFKNKYGLTDINFDDAVHKKCFSDLSMSRRKLHSDYIDAMCYATCIEYNRNLKNQSIKFISSEIPFEAFFMNNKIPHNNDSCIRNSQLIALVSYYLNKYNYNITNSIEDIDSALKSLRFILEKHNYGSKESLEVRKKIRNEFSKELINELKYNKVNYSNPFDLFFKSTKEGELVKTDSLYRSWINAVNEFFTKIDKTNGVAFQIEIDQVKEEVDQILELFYDCVNSQEYLAKEIERIKNDIIEFKTHGYQFEAPEILQIIRTNCEYYLSNDAENWDIKNLKGPIKEGLQNDKIADLVISDLYEYIDKGKQQNQLNFALKISNELKNYDAE